MHQNIPSTRRVQAKASPGRHAFTLVELLVVIGIIAVLVSMLIPTLQRARMQVKMVTCSNNMHQAGTAMLAYAADNDQYLPPQQSGYVAVTDPDSFVYKLYPYTKNYTAFQCGNAVDLPLNSGYPLGDPSLPLVSNLYNSYVCWPPLRLSQAKHSTQDIIFLDHAPLQNGSWLIGYPESDNPWWYPHIIYHWGGPPGQYRNVCFADGRVELAAKGALQDWQMNWHN